MGPSTSDETPAHVGKKRYTIKSTPRLVSLARPSLL